MTDPIIETRNLTFEYSNRCVALDDVSLTIPSGKKTVILGSNGSGKSTLFLHFNGILRPRSGEVHFDGKMISYASKALTELRKKIALVLQNPDDQIFSTTVEEDVAFGPMNLSLPRIEVEKRVEDALRLVGLEEMRERPTQQLSFGERKRVALAGALSMNPKVLIMDEPTAGLDSRMVRELMELADELNQKGMTVIMSTHDVETAYSWGDEIRVLHQGRLAFSGVPEDFFEDGVKVHDIGLVPPMLFEMNQYLVRMEGREEKPFPRTTVELVQKIFHGDTRTIGSGTIATISIDPDPKEVRMVTQRHKDESRTVGACGTRAKRFVEEKGIRTDYRFNAFENSVLGASEGRDFLLYIDSQLVPLLEIKFERLEREFGLKIPRRYVEVK